MLKNKKQGKSRKRRKYSYTGVSNSDSVLIGNYGDATVVVKGQFNLSGIVYCLEGKVEFFVDGYGQISLLGKCRHLVIRESDGDCILDFSELKCDMVTCENLRGQTTVILGESRRVDIISLSEEATLKILGNPLVAAHSLEDHARIICPRLHVAPLVVHPTGTRRTIL